LIIDLSKSQAARQDDVAKRQALLIIADTDKTISQIGVLLINKQKNILSHLAGHFWVSDFKRANDIDHQNQGLYWAAARNCFIDLLTDDLTDITRQ